jgi:hypothetical protein
MLRQLKKTLCVAARRDGNIIRTTEEGKVSMIIINSTGQQAFHQLLSASAILEMAVGVEVEWFADETKTIIGNIAFDDSHKGWNYAMLKQDKSGEFRVSERQGHFPTCHTARIALFRRMALEEEVKPWRLVA